MSNILRAYALSGSVLISFDPLNPSVGTSIPITGLNALDTLVGIDFRPSNGLLYGLGVDAAADTATLYSISVQTGAATVVGAPIDFAPTDLPVSGYGFDFNSTVDRIRVTTETGLNFRINPFNGTLAAIDPLISPSFQITGDAYTNNHQSMNPGGPTTLYVLDSGNDFLNIQVNPNGGIQMPVGATGVPFTAVNGFDIPAGVDATSANTPTPGQGFALLDVGGTTGFYSINLSTGAATLIGTFLNGAMPASGLALQNDFSGGNPNDFNDDGNGDLLFQNPDGSAAIWTMNGLILLRHELSRPANCCADPTTWAARQGFDERTDQMHAHGRN